ncbi:uncharacterized protein A4U43_C02F6350 [Asparagus officinalis]|uniref:Uncharacterized protein n=1 Tax=Asparagus officinalis TaxID=4686 RepID=A0A5P1FL64_ASPOF|nr:uncharacterized protein A4U43_C02F6350 [Asparagus officinalis]
MDRRGDEGDDEVEELFAGSGTVEPPGSDTWRRWTARWVSPARNRWPAPALFRGLSSPFLPLPLGHVTRSAIGFAIFSVLLTSWALTFMIGGEKLFGPMWNNLVMYNVADKLGLTGWT